MSNGTTETTAANERRVFTFETSKTYTGKVQYRADSAARGSTPTGDWLRGEVKAIKSEQYANALVAGGNHAHVSADAPVGQPDEFKPKTANAQPTTATESAPTTTSGTPTAPPITETSDDEQR